MQECDRWIYEPTDVITSMRTHQCQRHVSHRNVTILTWNHDCNTNVTTKSNKYSMSSEWNGAVERLVLMYANFKFFKWNKYCYINVYIYTWSCFVVIVCILDFFNVLLICSVYLSMLEFCNSEKIFNLTEKLQWMFEVYVVHIQEAIKILSWCQKQSPAFLTWYKWAAINSTPLLFIWQQKQFKISVNVSLLFSICHILKS